MDVLPVEKVNAVHGLQETIARTFQMSVGCFLEERQKMCSLIIRLEELAGYNIFDTGKAEEIFEIGYCHIKRLDLDELMEIADQAMYENKRTKRGEGPAAKE